MLEILVTYILFPLVNILIGAFIGMSWTFTENLNRILFGSVFLIGTQLAFIYQAGYRGFFLAGRKRFFYIVFVLPFIASFVSLSVGIVWKFFLN